MTRIRYRTSAFVIVPVLAWLAAMCSPPTASVTGSVPRAQTLDELSFYGEQQLQGRECTSSGGCTTKATLTHYNRMDLGWATIRHTGRTAAALEPRASWTGIKATAYCRLVSWPQPFSTTAGAPTPAQAFASSTTSCGTWSLNVGATNTVRTLTFNRSMAGQAGSIRVSFTGTWRGSSYTVHGYMPLFRCYTSERQCRFL
jgi:hypothetical protein